MWGPRTLNADDDNYHLIEKENIKYIQGVELL